MAGAGLELAEFRELVFALRREQTRALRDAQRTQLPASAPTSVPTTHELAVTHMGVEQVFRQYDRDGSGAACRRPLEARSTPDSLP